MGMKIFRNKVKAEKNWRNVNKKIQTWKILYKHSHRLTREVARSGKHGRQDGAL